MVDIKLQLPENFLSEEIRHGHLVTSHMKEIWAVELDLLNEFIRVCNKYGLKYWADGGTLLGAIRHQGYVPWDDDIDIIMMRPDYDRLCSVASTEFTHPYFFQTSSIEADCTFHHAKLRNSNTTGLRETKRTKKYNQGIWIDILPLENLPDDTVDFNEYIHQLQQLQEEQFRYANFVTDFKHKTDKGFSKCLKHELKHLYYFTKYYFKPGYSNQSICKEIDKALSSCKDNNTRRIANMSIIWSTIPRQFYWQRDWFDGYREEQFEFITISIPARGEEILNRLYGDWHKFVKGESLHSEPLLFDTDRPYTLYLK